MDIQPSVFNEGDIVLHLKGDDIENAFLGTFVRPMFKSPGMAYVQPKKKKADWFQARFENLYPHNPSDHKNQTIARALKFDLFEPSDRKLTSRDFDRKLTSRGFFPSIAEPEGLRILTTVALTHPRMPRMWITASPEAVDEAITFVSRAMRVHSDDVVRYVHPVTTSSHGAKYDIVVPNCKELAGLDARLGLFFNPLGKSCKPWLEIQIATKGLAGHLLEHGMIPAVD